MNFWRGKLKSKFGHRHHTRRQNFIKKSSWACSLITKWMVNGKHFNANICGESSFTFSSFVKKHRHGAELKMALWWKIPFDESLKSIFMHTWLTYKCKVLPLINLIVSSHKRFSISASWLCQVYMENNNKQAWKIKLSNLMKKWNILKGIEVQVKKP